MSKAPVPRDGPPLPCPTCGHARAWTFDTSAVGGRRTFCANCQRARRAARKLGTVEAPHEKRRRVARVALTIPCPKHGAGLCSRKRAESAVCEERRRAVHELARAYAEGRV